MNRKRKDIIFSSTVTRNYYTFEKMFEVCQIVHWFIAEFMLTLVLCVLLTAYFIFQNIAFSTAFYNIGPI